MHPCEGGHDASLVCVKACSDVAAVAATLNRVVFISFHVCQASQPLAVSPCSSSGSNPNWNTTCATSVPKPSPSPVISVAYALNVLGTRGPRRIAATMHTVLTEAADEICDTAEHSTEAAPLPMPEGVSGGAAIGAAVGAAEGLEVDATVLPRMPTGASAARSRGAVADCSGCTEDCGCGVCSSSVKTEPLILRNKPPRWHDQLQV